MVDNASADGSRNYFKGRFPLVKFIWQHANSGFSKANNSVLSRVSGEYVLFLNPDTIIAENTLDICLAFARRQSKFGALGIAMLDGSGNYLPESKRMFPSAITSFYKMSGITKLFPASPYFSKYYAAHIKENHSGEVEVLAGAFMMVHKKVLEITNGFDEDFFMYGEDIDLCYRITKAGYKNYYCGDTAIIHFKGESVLAESKSYLKNFYGAMFLFVKKHSGRNKMHMKAAILGAYALARLKHALFQTSLNQISEKNSIAVVAGDHVFNQVLHLIKYSVFPFLIKGRINVDQIDSVHTLGNLDALKNIVVKHQISHIVFAEGEVGFRKIIELMRANKNLVGFLIHAHGSKSIIGSSHKTKSGIHIADAR